MYIHLYIRMAHTHMHVYCGVSVFARSMSERGRQMVPGSLDKN